MKTMNKIAYVLIITITLFSCNSCNLNMISAGSYPYAEDYKLKIKESELIDIIIKFKSDNPQYCVPQQIKLIDGRSNDRDDHWYHIYFYYKEENQIIYTWIRQTENDNTSFAFVSIKSANELGNWKDINKDFSESENKLQKEKFEQRILNKIKMQIKN